MNYHTIRKFITSVGLALATSVTSAQAQATDNTSTRITFLGDSLTAGYGLSIDLAYPALVKELAARDRITIEIINSGVSGDTTAGALRRIEWVLRKPADILVISLGANDGLRGLDLNLTRTNLTKLIQKIREKLPKARIILMQMELPPTMGKAYTDDFRELFKEVAKENQVELGPFLLENVAGNHDLNQSDSIHPNEEGQKIIAGTVWDYLKPRIIDIAVKAE